MPPRVAFFTDSFHEVNGVALTSRQFVGFAERRGYPFFSVHTGPATRHWSAGPLETFEIASSHLLLGLEQDLSFDLLFWRHYRPLSAALERFQPDVLHVTGPGHCGLLGALLAHRRKIPLSASWHTNVHEFGARRLEKMLSALRDRWRYSASRWAERHSLHMTLRFYELARVLFAPNPELQQMLTDHTGRPVHLMSRGIDTNLFHPSRRTRTDDVLRLGYVGRLSAEKNVRLLAEIEHTLQQAGLRDYQFIIVGHGSEQAWLEAHLQQAMFPGVLRGEALADAYANMDLFVFPSETDTFGNVVLEAMASGVPALVTGQGGPKYLVESGRTGLVATHPGAFAEFILALHADAGRRQQMSHAARQASHAHSWEAVFERVYQQLGTVTK